MFLLEPERKQFFYSALHPLLYEISTSSWVVLIIIVSLFEVYSRLALQCSILVCGVCQLVYYIYLTSATLNRRTEQFNIRMYREQVILNKLQNTAWGTVTTLMFICFGSLWIFGTVGAIRLFGVVGIFDYFVLLCIATNGMVTQFGIIHFCGNLPKGCSEVLLRMRNEKGQIRTSKRTYDRKLLSKTVNSLKPFGIRSGPIRVMKHNALHLYFGNLINIIVSVLVANPSMKKY
jgi:hypothetical protein